MRPARRDTDCRVLEGPINISLERKFILAKTPKKHIPRRLLNSDHILKERQSSPSSVFSANWVNTDCWHQRQDHTEVNSVPPANNFILTFVNPWNISKPISFELLNIEHKGLVYNRLLKNILKYWVMKYFRVKYVSEYFFQAHPILDTWIVCPSVNWN